MSLSDTRCAEAGNEPLGSDEGKGFSPSPWGVRGRLIWQTIERYIKK